MKRLLRTLTTKPAPAILGAAAVLVAGLAAWLLLIKFDLIGTPVSQGVIYGMPGAKSMEPEGDKPSQADLPFGDAQSSSPETITNFPPPLLGTPRAANTKPAPSETLEPARTWVLDPVGQYCQGVKAFVNFQFTRGITDRNDWPGLEVGGLGERMTFVYGQLDFHHRFPEAELVISSPEGANPAIQMTCVLVQDVVHGALLNCTGPEDTTVVILVGGEPVEVSFMACERPEKEILPAETCRGRACG